MHHSVLSLMFIELYSKFMGHVVHLVKMRGQIFELWSSPYGVNIQSFHPPASLPCLD